MAKIKSLLRCVNCTSFSSADLTEGYCTLHCISVSCDDIACEGFNLIKGKTLENTLCNHCPMSDYRDTVCVKFDEGLDELAEVYWGKDSPKIKKYTGKEGKFEKISSLDQMRRVKSNCYLLNLFECYIPKEKDVPVELIKEDDCWMVVLPDVFEQPEGFELLHHYADNLHFWGKDFDTLEEALQVYNELCLKF